MGAHVVVLGQPRLQVGLQLLDARIDLLAKRHPIELVQHRAVKAFADAVGLGALHFGAGVINVLDG